MTLRDYIIAIEKTQLFISGREQIVVELFKAAGVRGIISKNTVKGWLTGYRTCRIKDYFPENTVDEAGFIEFISSRVNTSWPKLQKEFHSLSEEDCIVNLHTNDREIFYRSILNQFQKIHKLPLSEMPAKKMVRLFKNAVENCKISAFFEDDANFSDDADASGRIEVFLNSLHADIIEPFQLWHSESSMYQKILELHSELESFVILHKSEIDNLMSYYRSYEDTIRRCRQRIDTLYCEIYGIRRPQYESMTLGSFSFKLEQQTNSE